VEKSAVVARVFPSNLRFGHFELCFHMEIEKELDQLIDYSRTKFFDGKSVEEMLATVIERTAKLMAQWQDVGFCHGVMNTDNMSLLGLTIDYGPFGFLEDTNLNHICNHSDHQGRYAYGQQPSIGMWNLERLLVCFLNKVSKQKLQELLGEYPTIFEKEYQRLCRRKLGLLEEKENDFGLFVELLQGLHALSIDYTFFFRTLCRYETGKRDTLKAFWDYYGNRQEIIDWLKKYDARLSEETSADDERRARMLKTNPKYVLRNYIAQEVIDDVEKGSSTLLNQWLEVLYSPYEEHDEFEKYALPTPSDKKDFEVSCSS
jgi:uncharacterized protein YdiU (UPF0061 family)